MSVVSMKAVSGPLTADEQAEIDRLVAMSDADIDYSDIPEVIDGNGWQRGRFYRPQPGVAAEEAVTVRVDAATLAWFRSHTNGEPDVSAAMAAALRQFVTDAA